MTTIETRREERASPPSSQRRVGYVVAIAVNAVLVYIVNNLADWGWFGFLTDDLDRVTGVITLSLAVSLAVNVIYLFHDPPWLRSVGQIVSTAVGLVAVVRVWQVFPFDFSSYSFDWAVVVRFVLVVAIVGSAIGILVELVKLARGGSEAPPPIGRQQRGGGR